MKVSSRSELESEKAKSSTAGPPVSELIVDWNAKPEDEDNNIYHTVLVNDPSDPGRQGPDLSEANGFTIQFGRESHKKNSQGPYDVQTRNVDNKVYKLIIEMCGLEHENKNDILLWPLWCDDPGDSLPNPVPGDDGKPPCETMEYDEFRLKLPKRWSS